MSDLQVKLLGSQGMLGTKGEVGEMNIRREFNALGYANDEQARSRN